jgi:mRNA interferase HigB
MHFITRRRLREFWVEHPSAKRPLMAWYTQTKHAQWQSLVDVREIFPSADQVQRLTVFNIGGNKYHLITRIEYAQQKVYIRSVMTHAEYDKERWKDDPWYN